MFSAFTNARKITRNGNSSAGARKSLSSTSKSMVALVLDILAASTQLVIPFVLTVLFNLSGLSNPNIWLIPFALVLISFGWWQNFLYADNKFGRLYKIV